MEFDNTNGFYVSAKGSSTGEVVATASLHKPFKQEALSLAVDYIAVTPSWLTEQVGLRMTFTELGNENLEHVFELKNIESYNEASVLAACQQQLIAVFGTRNPLMKLLIQKDVKPTFKLKPLTRVVFGETLQTLFGVPATAINTDRSKQMDIEINFVEQSPTAFAKKPLTGLEQLYYVTCDQIEPNCVHNGQLKPITNFLTINKRDSVVEWHASSPVYHRMYGCRTSSIQFRLYKVDGTPVTGQSVEFFLLAHILPGKE